MFGLSWLLQFRTYSRQKMQNRSKTTRRDRCGFGARIRTRHVCTVRETCPFVRSLRCSQICRWPRATNGAFRARIRAVCRDHIERVRQNGDEDLSYVVVAGSDRTGGRDAGSPLGDRADHEVLQSDKSNGCRFPDLECLREGEEGMQQAKGQVQRPR